MFVLCWWSYDFHFTFLVDAIVAWTYRHFDCFNLKLSFSLSFLVGRVCVFFFHWFIQFVSLQILRRKNVNDTHTLIIPSIPLSMQVDPHSFTNSFFQVDPNNPIITLPDGTTAQVQGVATVSQHDLQHADSEIAAKDQQDPPTDRAGSHLTDHKRLIWQFVPSSQITGVTSSDGVTTLTNAADGTTVTTVDLTAVTESTIGQEGQHHILLTGEDGQSI